MNDGAEMVYYSTEDEVNCRLMELMHTKGEATDNDIRNIVRDVRKLYPNDKEGNLYGY